MIVEAAETLFVPVAIRNNTEGDHEAEIRESFQEPSWNNPVVRFLGPDRRELAPRLHRRKHWSRAAVADGMRRALEASGKEVPAWLSAFAEEEATPRPEHGRALFGMP